MTITFPDGTTITFTQYRSDRLRIAKMCADHGASMERQCRISIFQMTAASIEISLGSLFCTHSPSWVICFMLAASIFCIGVSIYLARLGINERIRFLQLRQNVMDDISNVERLFREGAEHVTIREK